jgi:UDP-3-O-[3-hydroxymyristoyl] glucosamine N-acyltransferase
MPKIIIGAGGWASEVAALTGISSIYVSDGFSGGQPLSTADYSWDAIIAIASPTIRERIYYEFPFRYIGYIHPSCIIYNSDISKDLFAAPNGVVTTSCKIGIQCQLNIGTIIGHSVVVGDFFTSAPNVFIGGDAIIGDRVYMGAGVLVKEKINICSDVTIGMGAVVVKDITKSGVYVGNPLRKIR